MLLDGSREIFSCMYLQLKSLSHVAKIREQKLNTNYYIRDKKQIQETYKRNIF